MRSSLDYVGFAQLCGRSPIMREIMRTHNRIIPRSIGVCVCVCVCLNNTSYFVIWPINTKITVHLQFWQYQFTKYDHHSITN